MLNKAIGWYFVGSSASLPVLIISEGSRAIFRILFRNFRTQSLCFPKCLINYGYNPSDPAALPSFIDLIAIPSFKRKRTIEFWRIFFFKFFSCVLIVLFQFFSGEIFFEFPRMTEAILSGSMLDLIFTGFELSPKCRSNRQPFLLVVFSSFLPFCLPSCT